MSSTTTTAEDRDRVIELLGRVPLFQGLPRDDLDRIADLVEGRELGEGEMLFREGDPGDKFYIVFSGGVEVLKERPRGDHERLAVKRAGEAFGEMSLLNDAPRSASIRAVEPTELLFVTREKFDELLGGESLAVRLMRGLAKALRALDVRFAARAGGMGGGGADALREFSRVVQHGLLPRRAPEVEGYDVAIATSQSDEGIGQALWDVFRLEDGTTVLATFEVRGGGLPPAHVLAVARALLRQIARHEHDVGGMLSRLNGALAENLYEGLDECVEVGLVTLAPDRAVWTAAGDQPGLLIRTDGETEELQPAGPALGILPEFGFGTTELPLESGDLLLFVSDADKGVLRGAGDLVHKRRDEAPAKLLSLLERALNQVDGRDPELDLTLALVRRK